LASFSRASIARAQAFMPGYAVCSVHGPGLGLCTWDHRIHAHSADADAASASVPERATAEANDQRLIIELSPLAFAGPLHPMCQERNRPHSWGLALARIAGVGKNVAATV
jgi:hypothetical protein